MDEVEEPLRGSGTAALEAAEVEGRLLALRLAVAALVATEPERGAAVMRRCVGLLPQAIGGEGRDGYGRKKLLAAEEETRRLWALVA